MGSSESFTEDPFSPPPPSRPAVFVLRNGRYEPQHYMPMPPRTNVIDFDGFVFRRVGGQLVDTKPPEMRQAALVQNPVNLHRDTFAVLQQAHSVEAPCAAGSSRQEAPTASFTFVFDATLPGTVSVRVLRPSEASVVLQETALPPNDSDTYRLNEKTASKNQVNSEGTLMPLTVDVQTFDAGLDQTYRSASLDLPASSVVDRSDHPDVLVIVKLQANTEDPKRPNVQVTYISLQPGAPDAGQTDWTAQIRAQEMRCGDQRFDLRDVFGVSARSGLAEVADGNPECIICLSEPRDTAVLPCRHLCFCSYCASIVRLQCDKCPVCRQRVASLLQLRKGADVRQTEPEARACASAKPGVEY
uniref:RING-type domain-containing protein n=1 Tax=Noctiluca scintillans TaxID=2966 RepID=A0A7S1AKB0_NOCSC|mmetsp:Transcript_49893/g.132554  ORF Transcript_49893/g.132554 Transcript_49893/m.132554 type:complete len:358 (+) Transcript_49893:105-1178(+)|eukprot:CAMPEP_0194527876 /NCGR_PEP_ID=MMETSP0253-20130528/64117_1 /TAXON_ID=2966 /ORGANISM="Noctiluca scintillans" /LENGTH=357 /DNA_ID=CAMNT_0039372871 /DNA_START=53 /DNA_END=1126 /DNA_ORIENTATION=+